MAEVETGGGIRLTEVAVAEGVRIRVRSPRMRVRWTTLEAAPGLEAMAPSQEKGGWNEAIDENELVELPAALQPEVLEPLESFDAEAIPTIAVRDSEDQFVDLRAQPLPGESLLVMVETDGVFQWFAPRNAPSVTEAFGLEGVEAPSAELQFQIPRSTLQRPLGLEGPEGVGGSIVRFFRTKLIPQLIGAPVRRLLEWLVDKVEKRAKPREGFRFFDRSANYPFAKPHELAALSGQRVLLLTHGIFTSLEGAFHGISDPKGAVLQHLRSVYGENIIGWDHWTVGKTPLENAEELLNALPAGIRPDILSHSRGALVTRAMLEHPSLVAKRTSRFNHVGKAIFVAGANQGSPLATLHNLNRLLNVYSAIASFPLLGGAGIALKVIVGVLRLLAHGATMLPSVEALSSDLSRNQFLRELNASQLTPTGELVAVHANYDPARGPLARFLDLNVDLVFGEGNDMVVPFTGAKTFDTWQQVGTNIQYGTPTERQAVVMHTNFFVQPGVHDLIQEELS